VSRPRARALLVAAAAALMLASCGKKGPPEAPEGSTYPRVYPKPSSMVLEGDLLEPTRTIRERGGIRGGVDIYPDDSDFPEDDGFDRPQAEKQAAPESADEDDGGDDK
jgi:hypothetical protein